MNSILRFLFFNVFVRFVVCVVIGLNVRNRQNLPQKGPAIIVANHNSHLDTMVLMTLFSAKLLPDTHPVAAFDYFLKNKLLAWFSLKVIGIIPLKRTIDRKTKTDPFEGTYQALEAGKTLILFPEGSRGEPEKMSSLKGGVARLAKRYPDVQIIPVFMHGLGKALPRGEALLVPFFCDVFIGEALPKFTSKPEFMASLESSIHTLAEQAKPVEWE